MIILMVPGGGFEPPTRGFSVHCSTPELPGHGNLILGEPHLGCVVRSVQRHLLNFRDFEQLSLTPFD